MSKLDGPLTQEEVTDLTDEQLRLALSFLQESIRAVEAEQKRRARTPETK